MKSYDFIMETVGSGNFAVSKSRTGSFQCHLGTCVGLVIVDRENNVGGLYHIILPAPVETGEVWEPNNYASTGTPHFLDKLIEAGAQKENMVATIAGGALIGPISKKDLDLDIGGKTTDVVIELLNKEGIPVTFSETGGYFSCSLILDLKTLNASIMPIGAVADSRGTEVAKITKEEIDRTITRIRPIPQVALKVFRMMNSEEYNMHEIALEIKKDQILGAKVINLSNTPFFNPRGKIASIDQALVVLGEKRLLQIILSSSIEIYFQDSGSGYSLCRGGLYHHSVGTAIAAENLAKLTKKVAPDVAYTAGLLHDIGKVVLDQFVAKAYPLFYRGIYDDQKHSVEVEDHILGFSHPETGERLAQLWSLPPDLTDVIKNHHHPGSAETNPDLVHLIYIADLLMSRFQVGDELERIDTACLMESMEIVGFEMTDFPLIIDAIPWTMFDTQSSKPI